MTSLSDRLDNLTETVASLKANLDSYQSQANDVKKSVKFTPGEVQDLKPVFPKLAEVEKRFVWLRILLLYIKINWRLWRTTA